jgi:LPXTG-motif cell wall-anchored protein
MNRRTVFGIIIVLALSLGWLGTALAHAELVSSDPAAGTKLTKAPAKVTLIFSEEIDDQGSSFTVTDAKKATVGTGKLDLNDLDHKTLTGTLNAGLGDGVYTVAWDVLTSDDEAEESGTFTFGVNADPGAQPTAVPEEEATAVPTTAATPAPTTRPTTAAAGAAQPTATPSTGAGPATLPTTGDTGADWSAYLLMIAILFVAGGIALWRSKRSAR